MAMFLHSLQVGLRNNLPIMAPVDNAGLFTEEAGQFQGDPCTCFICQSSASQHVWLAVQEQEPGILQHYSS